MFLLSSVPIKPDSQWKAIEPLIRDADQYRLLESKRTREACMLQVPCSKRVTFMCRRYLMRWWP